VFGLCLAVFGVCVYVTMGSGLRQRPPIREEEKVVESAPDGTVFAGVACGNRSALPESEPAPMPPEFFEEPAVCQLQPEQPIIVLEEEVEITRNIPRGTSFDNLSQRNVNSTSCLDAYGLRPVVKRPVIEP
jgi:hypothetical protein